MKNLQDGLESNFNTRSQSQSSTSKYIQTKVVDDKGNYTGKTVDGTPDDLVIKPNLKTSTCTTTKFEINSVGDLIKTTENKVIKEAAPAKEKSEYGKIVVNESRGGFVSLKDETPGNKRILNLHPSGSYNQIVNDGTTYEKIVYDKYTFINKNWNVSVGADFIEVIYGNSKIQITKDAMTNITGNESKTIKGNSAENVSKHMTKEVGGNYTENITGSLVSTAKSFSGNYKNSVSLCTGSSSNTIMKDKTEVVCGSLNICVSGNVVIASGGTMNLTGNVLINGRIPMVR